MSHHPRLPTKGAVAVGARPYIFALAMALLVLGGIAVASAALQREIGYFTRDPAQTTGEHFYLGILSNLGACVWMFGSAAGLLTWASEDQLHVRSPWLHAGLITFFMGSDDLFLLHEAVWPNVLFLLSENVVAALYLLAIAVFYVMHRSFVRRFGGLIAVPLAVGFWSASKVVDLAWDLQSLLLEDGAKFLGTVTWCTFLICAAIAEPRLRRIDQQRATAVEP